MQVVFCPEEIAAGMSPSRDMAVISITNPGDVAKLRDGWGAVLRVAFADAAYDEQDIRYLGRLWRVSSRGFPEKRHAIAIQEFIGALDPAITRLVVHCGAGQSRSAAVAMYAAKTLEVGLYGDMSRHNRTVLRLLDDPSAFDQLLAEVCPVVAERRSGFARLLDFVRGRQ